MKLAELNEVTGLDVLDHLDRDVDIPIDTNPSPQGDLLLVPAALDPYVNPTSAWQPIPATGLVLVAGTHDHTLYATGTWCTATDDSGCATHLIDLDDDGIVHHIEHGYRRPAAGKWAVRRQQEGAAERRRMVAD